MVVSTADPAWVFGTLVLVDAQGQPDSDEANAILNLTTHQLIGPEHLGFCGTTNGVPGGGTPSRGYAAVPTAVLTNFGLAPCAPPATSSAPTSSPPAAPSSLASFAGKWYVHETGLVISNAGAGRLDYPDFTACPHCSMADAPRSTMDFALTAVTGGAATGRVTASSDVKNYTLGMPVRATLMTGHPGQLLQVTIGGEQNTIFCNPTAAAVGQCGA
jgi:hypothetical protein